MVFSMWLWLPEEGEASCAYGSLGSDQAITKSDIADYKVSVCSYFDGMYGGCALAVSGSGAWGTGCGSTDSHATSSAIKECQIYAQQHESCTLVDLRAESMFIKEFKSPEQIALEEARRLGEEKQRKAEHKTLKKQTTTASTYSSSTASTLSSEKIWCAHSGGVVATYPVTCRAWDGKSYNQKYLAEAEHKRLKGIATATAPQPTPQPEPKPVQATTVDNSALDLEFWQSIKESNNKNMFREYLRQFPSGVYSGLAKIKLQELSANKKVQAASIPSLDYGGYYALVIGNNDYQDLTNLRSAVNDAKAVSTVLEVDYGFNVKLLENASRKDILRSLKHLRETVSAKDNVLIYYAGHGYLDQAADEGYWLPIDAVRSDQSNWIATDRIVSQVKAMKAKHVMVVVDSCFSGTITRAIKIEQRTPEWLSEIVKKKARTALTSGGLEPVMDTGSGNHSAFAYAFISLLEENDGVLDASQLFSKLRPKVMANSTQTPQYGKIHMAGDDGGDFLFVRR
jgi:hypothetical protein